MTAKKTLRLVVDVEALDSASSTAALRRAAELLRQGGTVAFPTETVYGLGANALDERAVQAIFEAKQRPAWDPLIVHIAATEQLALLAATVPPAAHRLMDAFWPGPLTLLLPKGAGVPAIVTAGRDRVGVRMPNHPVARKLIELAKVPIAAPSANSFGRTSPTRAEFVLEDLDGRIDAVIDAGESTLGLESTVVDVCDEPAILYRPGMLTFEDLQSLCPSLIAYHEPERGIEDLASLPSPGVGLKHYAPRARLILLEAEAVPTNLQTLIRELQVAGEVVGVMLTTSMAAQLDAATRIYRWGDLTSPDELARRLFAGLRQLDALGSTVILCPLPQNKGLGVTLRDRLNKAAR